MISWPIRIIIVVAGITCLGTISLIMPATFDLSKSAHAVQRVSLLEIHESDLEISTQKNGDISSTHSMPRFEDFGEKRIHEYLDACLNLGAVPEVVWTFWFGTKRMNENRFKAFDSMQNTIGVHVILLTDKNISDYARWPIHPMVQFLSGNHKSDYYRIYFSLHYGGGYGDVKNMQNSWKPLWSKFDDPKVWIVGAPETPDGMAWIPGHFPGDGFEDKVISNGWLISRSKNPLLEKVHDMQHDILDRNADELIAYPPPDRNRCCAGQDPQGYPIRWTELMGELMVFASQEYYDHLDRSMPFPNMGDYL